MGRGRTVKVKCAQCRRTFQKSVGAYNRAMKINSPLYCSQKCCGISRRKSVEEKKRLKKEWKKKYDRKLRLSEYGEYAECYEILEQLVKQIKQQMPDRFERYAQAGRQQWNPINQQRRRYARASRIDSE